MKTVFTLLLWVVCAYASNATVRTVCNMPYSPGQFTTFSDAINASNDYDTIYMHGSSINYGDLYIWRPLVVIGTGHHPIKQSPLISAVGTVTIYANNVQLIGLQLTYVSSYGYNNCAVKKCRFPVSVYNESISLNGSGWLIEGNVIESNSNGIVCFGSASPNTIIRHNVFIANSYAILGIRNMAGQLSYILNNVFLTPNNSGQTAMGDLSYLSIENNIFYYTSPGGNYGAFTNTTMNNNISYSALDNNFYTPGANNLVNVDPQFVNYPAVAAQFDYNWDLNLNPASPAHNTGTDGTDRGVFGGLGNLFSNTGEPAIAEVTAFTITSPSTIAPGGSLTISITSKRVH